MEKVTLYAIVDEQSGWFVTRQDRLAELGADTLFFTRRSEAMRKIEQPVHPNIQDIVKTTRLQNELAWDLLEKVHEKPRWFIDVEKPEYDDAVSQFKKLKVRRIDIGYEAP